MDIKELNKRQLILVTLLITFVVSIATGIVTVSLMQQMPKSVPQTINNIIQRTIEKVTTVQVPTPVQVDKKNIVENKKESILILGEGSILISVYSIVEKPKIVTENVSIINEEGNISTVEEEKETILEPQKPLGQGILISEAGLVLIETSILNKETKFKVVLNETDFDAIILKKFDNNFTILRIISSQEKKDMDNEEIVTSNSTDLNIETDLIIDNQ